MTGARTELMSTNTTVPLYSDFLEEHKEIPYFEEIFKIGQCLCIQKDEIIEQLGRMYAQDGYSEETIVEAAMLAARFYHNGNTVKEIAAYLRRVRKAKSWDV